MNITDKEAKAIELKAYEIRRSMLVMLTEAKSGHTGGPMGLADIYATLYFSQMNHNPMNPQWRERDMLVVSNGHTCPILYTTLAHAGYFPIDELKTLRKFGSRLQGHPHRERCPFVETSSGPLASGLSQIVGMAIADRMDSGKISKRHFYAILSDGEHDSGQIWEAGLLASKEKLGNLIAILDRNNIQIDGFTEDIMPLAPLYDKWKSFGWHVQEVDGHDIKALINAIQMAKTTFDKPSMIIAHTVPGKGVDFMENRFEWHGTPPDLSDVSGAPAKGKQLEECLRQIDATITKLKTQI